MRLMCACILMLCGSTFLHAEEKRQTLVIVDDEHAGTGRQAGLGGQYIAHMMPQGGTVRGAGGRRRQRCVGRRRRKGSRHVGLHIVTALAHCAQATPVRSTKSTSRPVCGRCCVRPFVALCAQRKDTCLPAVGRVQGARQQRPACDQAVTAPVRRSSRCSSLPTQSRSAPMSTG